VQNGRLSRSLFSSEIHAVFGPLEGVRRGLNFLSRMPLTPTSFNNKKAPEFSGRNLTLMEQKVSTELVSVDHIATDAEIPRWKHALDAICIILALPVIVPLVLLIAATIKLVSRGPVLFKQERIGYLGRPFTLFKFRTMRVDAPSVAHQQYLKELMSSPRPMIKMDIKGDSRLIPLGGLLRATGLDELPQILNVLCGEMSLVGPRPCTVYEFDNYLPWHTQRLKALPGLSGLWQVNGKNRVTFEQMVQMDIYYAENQSLWMDLIIMLKTFPVLAIQLIEAVEKRFRGRTGATTVAPARTIALERMGEMAESRSNRDRLNRTCKEKKWQSRLALE